MNFNLEISDINYIKIVYKDKNGFSHYVKTIVKHLGDNEIHSCLKSDEWENIPANQDVLLSFVSDNGVYKTNALLKYADYQEPYVYFVLKTPTDVKYEQNREFFRVKIRQEATISYKQDGELQTINCITYDISANGVRFELPSPIHFPSEVFIRIKFESKDISTTARFVRNDTEDKITKAAFVFENFSEQNRDFLSQVCIRKQIEDKRKKNEML